MSVVALDAERFGEALEEGAAAFEVLPGRLRELAALAAEVADALGRPSLSVAERQQIARRVRSLARRRRRVRLPGTLPPLRRSLAFAAGAGGAALGLSVLGLALLRRLRPVAPAQA